MTPEQFTYWLQGFSEVTGTKQPTKEQWQIIQDHLSTVFVKVTPTRDLTTDTTKYFDYHPQITC